jgi:hypothetical protein
MDKEDIKFAKLFHDCKKKAVNNDLLSSEMQRKMSSHILRIQRMDFYLPI